MDSFLTNSWKNHFETDLKKHYENNNEDLKTKHEMPKNIFNVDIFGKEETPVKTTLVKKNSYGTRKESIDLSSLIRKSQSKEKEPTTDPMSGYSN